MKKGHKLALVFNTYDPSDLTIDRQYEVTFKTDSISALIPTLEASRLQKANYIPNALDTVYAALPEIIGAKLVAPAILEVPEYILDSEEGGEVPSVQLAVHYAEHYDQAVGKVQKISKQQAPATLPETGSNSDKGILHLGLALLVSTLGLSSLAKKYSQR